ncbi:MAG: D-aminoacyl-tRNA deacylase [Bdellovibrionaceae bacterium]|nr:D-aminoacyl-tRNA deacylase [Pseudobdellovibrionaceae bacterium]
MKAVVQRVKRARVTVDGDVVAEIGPGLLTFLGIERGDGPIQLEWLINKIVGLRIFADSEGKMKHSIQDTGGAHLIVSQFTLMADTSRGLRPSFTQAAPPDEARPFVDLAIELSRKRGVITLGGRFQSHMEVELTNDGPLTLALESPK